MYKIAGNRHYPYGSISPSDPSKLALGYPTLEEAQYHADSMNKSLITYPDGWNTDYWKTKPEPWVVFKVVKDSHV